MPGAVVASECDIRGDITVGTRTVIHPKARIIADAGPIRIGESNLIEEQVEIINSVPNTILIIGDFNVFEVGSLIIPLLITVSIRVRFGVIWQGLSTPVFVSKSLMRRLKFVAQRYLHHQRV